MGFLSLLGAFWDPLGSWALSAQYLHAKVFPEGFRDCFEEAQRGSPQNIKGVVFFSCPFLFLLGGFLGRFGPPLNIEELGISQTCVHVCVHVCVRVCVHVCVCVRACLVCADAAVSVEVGKVGRKPATCVAIAQGIVAAQPRRWRFVLLKAMMDLKAAKKLAEYKKKYDANPELKKTYKSFHAYATARTGTQFTKDSAKCQLSRVKGRVAKKTIKTRAKTAAAKKEKTLDVYGDIHRQFPLIFVAYMIMRVTLSKAGLILS